ncbi:hypothetical protein Q7C09_01350, partial [Heyndrickxia coagulans]|uniref:hypothetical protein n=1 Tax=Heyndrickxia coagulans TaxID=1398 RepID=UPI00281169EA
TDKRLKQGGRRATPTSSRTFHALFANAVNTAPAEGCKMSETWLLCCRPQQRIIMQMDGFAPRFIFYSAIFQDRNPDI